MNLNNLMLEKIKKRTIDDMALLYFPSLRGLDKEQFENWKEDFYNLSIESFEDLLNVVYKQQGESISNATSRCIDFIKIPVLGSIRLNRIRLEILALKDEKGFHVDESEIDKIKARHLEQIIALQNNSTVNIPININEKKT